MEAAALKGETVNLMDLPTEILARIIEDVYWDSQDESALSFGPSLQSLTLVNKAIGAIASTFRYRDWEIVMERDDARLASHLTNIAWQTTCRKLVVPCVDFRSRLSGSLDRSDYDRQMAAVVRSAQRLEQLTLVVSDLLSWPANTGFHLLPETIAACIAHRETRHLDILGISRLKHCDIACNIIESWQHMHTLVIDRSLEQDITDAERGTIGYNLWNAIRSRKGLKSLSVDLELVEDTPETLTPANSYTLVHLRLTTAGHNLSSDGPGHLYRMLRSHSTVTTLDIEYNLLSRACVHDRANPLVFPNLRKLTLHLLSKRDINFVDGQFLDNLNFLQSQTSLFSPTSSLRVLEVTGAGARLFLHKLVNTSTELPRTLTRIKLLLNASVEVPSKAESLRLGLLDKNIFLFVTSYEQSGDG